VAKDDAEIGSLADLEASDCNVGSMTGTTNYDLSVDVVGEARIVAFESFAFAVQSLITGDVCAVIMDDVAGQGYQGANADAVSMVDEVLQADPLGFAFTEGSDLVAPFNAAIQSMKADGTLAALNGKYFGTAFTITYDDIGDGAYAEEVAVPVFGGTLRIGLEAETDGLNPAGNRFAISAYQMGGAVYDYMVGVEETPCFCEFKPILAESWTHSDDYVTWDFKLREGVKFHDGTTFSSEAVLKAFKMQLTDPTVGIAIRALFAADDPETEYFEPAQIIDDYTIRFHALRPHVDFPGIFSTQLGMIPSLAYMEAAEADGSLNQAPVGTGPFMIDSRVQDSMTRFVRNPDYWQGDVYLDAVEFYIYTDGEIGAAALGVGDIDAMGTSNVDAILAIRDLEGDGYVLYEDDRGDEIFSMANASHPPFDDIRARKALTYAFPRDDYLEFIGAGVLRAADQAFTPESIYYHPDVKQEHDMPELAGPLVAEYCADVPDMCSDGKINAEYQYSGPSVIQERVYDLFTEAYSPYFNFTKDMLLQDDHITHAILGMWDFITWRQFGSLNPDGHILWTSCEAIGALSLNWPRYCDPAGIDEPMFAARASTDREANLDLWRTWTESIHDSYTYLFQAHAMWTHGYAPRVKNVCGYTFPDGSAPLCHINGGNPGWHHMWIEE